MNLHPVIEGDTARIVFQLWKASGVKEDGTGLTIVALEITGNDGTVVDTTGDFGWHVDPAADPPITQADGQGYYDPDADDFVASKSPYRVRAKLTDGSDKVRHYPQGAASEMVVRTAR